MLSGLLMIFGAASLFHGLIDALGYLEWRLKKNRLAMQQVDDWDVWVKFGVVLFTSGWVLLEAVGYD